LAPAAVLQLIVHAIGRAVDARSEPKNPTVKRSGCLCQCAIIRAAISLNSPGARRMPWLPPKSAATAALRGRSTSMLPAVGGPLLWPACSRHRRDQMLILPDDD
jgi:hypothetical protein